MKEKFMNRITVTYSEEQDGDALVYTRTRQFDSRPTLEQLDDFFEEVIETIEPDVEGDKCDCGICQNMNEDQESEFVLQVADMVEDVITDTIIDTIESYMDSVLDEVDGITHLSLAKLGEEKGYTRGLVTNLAFADGFKAGLSHVEDIMFRKFEEAVDALETEHDCDGCCAECNGFPVQCWIKDNTI
jgi:hypothetical protein